MCGQTFELKHSDLVLLINTHLKDLCGRANGTVVIPSLQIGQEYYTKIEFEQTGGFELSNVTNTLRFPWLSVEDLVKLFAFISKSSIDRSTFILKA